MSSSHRVLFPHDPFHHISFSTISTSGSFPYLILIISSLALWSLIYPQQATVSSKPSSSPHPQGHASGYSPGWRAGRLCLRSWRRSCRSGICGVLMLAYGVFLGVGWLVGSVCSGKGLWWVQLDGRRRRTRRGVPSRCQAQQGEIAVEHPSGSLAREIDGLGWVRTSLLVLFLFKSVDVHCLSVSPRAPMRICCRRYTTYLILCCGGAISVTEIVRISRSSVYEEVNSSNAPRKTVLSLEKC